MSLPNFIFLACLEVTEKFVRGGGVGWGRVGSKWVLCLTQRSYFYSCFELSWVELSYVGFWQFCFGFLWPRIILFQSGGLGGWCLGGWRKWSKRLAQLPTKERGSCIILMLPYGQQVRSQLFLSGEDHDVYVYKLSRKLKNKKEETSS